MILKYHKKTGVIFDGICSREIRRNSDNMYDSKAQRFITTGDCEEINVNHGFHFFRDTDISLRYLMCIKGENRVPNFKFILKDGKLVKIVPIAGFLPIKFRQLKMQDEAMRFNGGVA